MSVRIGVNALNWYGRSLRRDIIPIRKIVKEECVSDYAAEFQYIDFVLHLGEKRARKKIVSIQKRAASIGCGLYLDVPTDVSIPTLRYAIADELSKGALEIVSVMSRSAYDFAADVFLVEIEHAALSLKQATL